MPAEKIHFNKEKETMLISLYSRSLESRTPDPVLRDPWAEQTVDRIDYDFAHLKINKIEPLSIAIRAKQFDLWTGDFIKAHPDAVVLHLGCGLDSRVFRIDPPAGVRWFDVDYPEVIDLRKRLYPEERPGYRLIGSSLADLGWLDEIPTDGLAMIVAEGVMMYLTEAIVKPLLSQVTGHFASGQVAFDALSTQGVRMAGADRSVKTTGAAFGWGLDDPAGIKAYAPNLELVSEMRTSKMPGYERLPLSMRLIVQAMEPFPSMRRMNRLLLFSF